MSDRIKGFWVALDDDYRDEYFKLIKDAVLMIKGVAGVNESITDGNDYVNRTMIELELKEKIWKIFKEKE